MSGIIAPGARLPAPTSGQPDAMGPTVAALEALAQRLEDTGDYRVLRRVAQGSAVTRPGSRRPGMAVAILLDVETTGIEPASSEVIELGMLAVEYDKASGRIEGVLRAFDRFRQPAGPIPAEVVRLTGITNGDVSGLRIADAEVAEFVQGAAIVVAHHAAFDRAHVEKAWPLFERLPWACSLEQVDWSAEGFEGRRLRHLVLESGAFHRGHRALSDCEALLHLLGVPLPASGKLAMAAMLERARQTGVRIWALEAPYEARAELKQRGYRWPGDSRGVPRAWNIELPEARLEDELTYLERRVYKGAGGKPRTVAVGALERFSSRAGIP